MEPVTVRGLTIGTGSPKIAVPLMGETTEALEREAAALRALPADLAEWRVDWFGACADPKALSDAARLLREALGELPILATFRTAGEGGQRAVSLENYAELVLHLLELEQVDLIDLELFTGGARISQLVEACHRKGKTVILSSHDFRKTPPEAELIRRMDEMEALGADITKIAVMPQMPEDVLTLLSATVKRTHYAARPMITMSMGGLGAVSRLGGETFGSALTFGCGANASAPGQIPAGTLAQVLELLGKK